MNSALEKIKRTVRYLFYKYKNNWNFPSNVAHITGGEMAKGCYEPQILDIIKNNLKRDGIFFDIGANVGYFSRFASEIVGETGHIYAFEAENANYRALCRNIAHLKNVTPIHFAISNENRLLNFFESSHSSSHSVFRSSKNLNGSQFVVPSLTLDYFWQTYLDETEICLVKIDVEGGEIQVLKGMKKMLAENKIESIILEFHPYIISNSGNNYNHVYSILKNYFQVFLIREKSEKKIKLESPEYFKQVTEGILKAGKNEKLDLFCIKKK